MHWTERSAKERKGLDLEGGLECGDIIAHEARIV